MGDQQTEDTTAATDNRCTEATNAKCHGQTGVRSIDSDYPSEDRGSQRHRNSPTSLRETNDPAPRRLRNEARNNASIEGHQDTESAAKYRDTEECDADCGGEEHDAEARTEADVCTDQWAESAGEDGRNASSLAACHCHSEATSREKYAGLQCCSTEYVGYDERVVREESDPHDGW